MNAPAVQYVTTNEGVSLAYVVTGTGPPLVLLPQLFSHVQAYWTQETFLLPWFRGLAERFRLIQYDGRNQGMSSRNLPVPDMEVFVRDLEAVADRLDVPRFLLFGADWHTHTAVRFAVAHPERVAGLILSSCSADNSAWPMAIYLTLASQNWDAFLRSQVAAGQSADLPLAFRRLSQTTTQEDWIRFARAAEGSDISDLLPRITVPTLVLHGRDFFNLPPEESMRFASQIPNASIVLMDGAQGMGSPSSGLTAIDNFVAKLPVADASSPASSNGQVAGLSVREIEVLRLLAAGKSNQQIADELVISLNTVNRHVSNIYAKTGAANRAEAVGYAHRHGMVR